MRIQNTTFKPNQPAFKQIYKVTVAKKCFTDDANNSISPSLLNKEQYIRELIKENMVEEIKKFVLRHGVYSLIEPVRHNRLQKVLESDFLPDFSVVGEQSLWSYLEDAVENTFPMEYVINTINPNIKHPMNSKLNTFYVYSQEHCDIFQEILSEGDSYYDKFLNSKEARESRCPQVWAYTKKMETIKKQLDEAFEGEKESEFIASSKESLRAILKMIVEENIKK
ncbi:MAG TPA: hypothetical protein PLG15_00315 [Candidatus Gastranaerophilaceae bacterium]|nr:hypothetical protein [Candidatus Gastranaerophilaceae bacterium]HPT40810.1 hypothetical protein [Candidatus Gastranaerophilaceae bacterium]